MYDFMSRFLSRIDDMRYCKHLKFKMNMVHYFCATEIPSSATILVIFFIPNIIHEKWGFSRPPNVFRKQLNQSMQVKDQIEAHYICSYRPFQCNGHYNICIKRKFMPMVI